MENVIDVVMEKAAYTKALLELYDKTTFANAIIQSTKITDQTTDN
jgi:hypothetical protein